MMMENGWFAAMPQWLAVLGTTPLEITATLCSLAGLVLVARQNVWGWPLGMVWAGISTYLAWKWALLSDAVLYAAYVPIQAYCWVVWARGKKNSVGNDPKTETLRPHWMGRRAQTGLAVALGVSVVVWALGMRSLAAQVSWIPAPALLWRDSTTTVLNFFAQFLQAHKRMENWVLWLVVNVLGIHIYWVKDAPVYSAQYAIFLALGLYGWWKWQASMRQPPAEWVADAGRDK